MSAAFAETMAPAAGTRRRGPGFAAGLAILAVIVGAALLAPWITPANPYEQDLLHRLVLPVWSAGGTWEHPLGTDHLGRDYLSRLVYGARISLLIGTAVALISGFIGTVLGVLAGYFGGIVDRVISLLITVRLALPVILVALAAVAIVGPSIELVVCVLGPLLWDRFALVVRTATRRIVSMDYVTAAKALGCSTWQVILRDVLPNLWTNILVVATMEFSHAIVLEAALSFLGLGTPPPTPSWGLMISEGKSNILFHAWLIALPGSALVALVLAVNMIGDNLRRPR
ncbi:MAG: ABC transporter permease [Betaproteobacteria bacterium]|nr:ABC transporter permease [Betaproteobacteria bacterium]